MAKMINLDTIYNEPTPTPTAQPTPTVKKEDGMTVLRDLADANNVNLGWDANTRNVLVGDKQYTREQMQQMGGVLNDGRWSLPTDTANSMFGLSTPPPTTDTPTAEGNPLQSILDMINSANEGWLQTQTAIAKGNMENQLAELQASLNRAIQEGQMSVIEAREAYEKQKGAIEKQAYADSERTGLVAEDRGIGNSQQMLGMMASDQARANSLKNENIVNRDNRILQIQERIKGLSADADIQKNIIQRNYENQILSAQGQANQNVSGATADLMKEDYFSSKNQEFQKWMQEDNQEFQSGENQAQRDWQSSEAGIDRQWKSMESALGRNHDVVMQGNQFAHDAKMTAVKFQNDLVAMSKQFGYNMSMENLRSSNNIKEAQARMDMDYSQYLKQANNELLKAYSTYNDPNSLEYKTRVAQVATELNEKIETSYKTNVGGVMVDMMFNKPMIDETLLKQYENLPVLDPNWQKQVKDFTGDKAFAEMVQPVIDYRQWEADYGNTANMFKQSLMNQPNTPSNQDVFSIPGFGDVWKSLFGGK